MRIVYFVAATILLIAPGSAALAQSGTPRASLEEAAEFLSKKDADAKIGESMLAPIRSTTELETYLQSRKVSPFSSLSERSQRLFLESLVFTEKGLASYRYRELEEELTPRQAFELLSLFGAQKTIAQLRFLQSSPEELEAMAKIAPVLNDDHRGYRCVPPATCLAAMDMICIGVNCGMFPP
jgi:hypothetical protein